MGKILSGLRYGNRKTKTYIILTGLIGIGAILCAALAVINQSPLWGMGAAFLAIAILIMTQSMKFQVTGQVASKEIDEKEEIKHKIKQSDYTERVNKTSFHENKDDENGNEIDIIEQEKDLKKDNSKKENSKKEDTYKEYTNKEYTNKDEDILKNEEEEPEESNFLAQYSGSDVKKLFVSYKVNKSHRPIMIDSYQSEKVRQCPGYIWVDRTGLKLLVLEKKPRMILVSKSKITTIQYEKGVSAYPRMDYAAFEKTSFIGSAFRKMLPTVYQETVNGRSSFRKNLYVIADDLKITNTSVHEMFDLLQAEFDVKDRIMDSFAYSTYFKSAYKINILLRDGVISITEFKNRIKKVLESLAHASISSQEFMDDIDQLVKGRLITKEYADYYIEYRSKHTK